LYEHCIVVSHNSQCQHVRLVTKDDLLLPQCATNRCSCLAFSGLKTHLIRLAGLLLTFPLRTIEEIELNWSSEVYCFLHWHWHMLMEWWSVICTTECQVRKTYLLVCYVKTRCVWTHLVIRLEAPLACTHVTVLVAIR